MKKAIKYLLAMLLTAWTGALTIAVGLRVLVWLFELMDKASNNGAFAAAGLIGALVLLTAAVSEAVKSLVQKWDNKKD